MYFYIYDSFLNAPKYRKVLERIEVCLQNFGIAGKIRRLNILHHQKEAIEENIRRGAKTIVLVGDDRSVLQAVQTMAQHDIPLGLIPIGGEENNRVARTLGIPPNDLACEVLSRRTIARLDLGKAQNYCFLTQAETRASTFICVGPKRSYRIQPTVQKTLLSIVNLHTSPPETQIKNSPRDAVLELVIRNAPGALQAVLGITNTTTPSVFPVQEISVLEPAGAELCLDGYRTIKLPVVITIAPQKLRVIVGRERLFR